MKTYLENLMRTTSPQEHERVIESETSRLQDVRKFAELNKITLFSHLAGRENLDTEKIAKLLENADSYEEFRNALGNINRSARAFLDDVVEKFEPARRDMSEGREVVGKQPFNFQKILKRSPAPNPRSSAKRSAPT
jgi:hypothetical protein